MHKPSTRYGISNASAASCPDVHLFKPLADRARRDGAISTTQIEGLGCRRFHFRNLWEALTDYDLWPIYLLGLPRNIPNTPIQAYLTLILKSLGFRSFEANLLTIPAYVLLLSQLIFWTWFSEKINNRFLIVLLCQFRMLPLLVALEVLPKGQGGPWARYYPPLRLPLCACHHRGNHLTQRRKRADADR